MDDNTVDGAYQLYEYIRDNVVIEKPIVRLAKDIFIANMDLANIKNANLIAVKSITAAKAFYDELNKTNINN